MGKVKTTAELSLDAGTTLDVDSAGNLQVNSSGGTIGIGNDAVAQNINIGTGAAARTITIGNATGATGVSVNTGTGAANFGTNATAHTTTIGSTTGASTTTIQSGTGGLNVGTGAIARTVTIGNTTGATAVNVNIGTGDFTMASASGTLISQLDTGEMTQPLQPAFLAYLDTDDLNQTGGGSTYTLGSGNALIEVYDQGGDFTTAGVFTAPVTGRYLLISNITYEGLTSGMTQLQQRIVTSNRSYFTRVNIGAIRANDNSATFNLSAIADMDAGDTATTTAIISGATDIADIAGSGTLVTYFSGKLAC